MNQFELGKIYIKDNEEYECIGYTENPTYEMKKLKDGQRFSLVESSPYSEEWKYKEDEFIDIEEINNIEYADIEHFNMSCKINDLIQNQKLVIKKLEEKE